jgi:predicted kinase
MLIIVGGLPGAGKTTIARELARRLGAVHVRIDSIEQAIRDSGVIAASLDDAGYRAGYAVAEDNLRIGRTVVADSVNPIPLTREGWLDAASRAGVAAVEVEITCSDEREHRRRVEDRVPDIAGLTGPAWQDVVDRDYRPWQRDHIIIDTAGLTIEQSVDMLAAMLRAQLRPD